ncbi:MAG: hypothetical protein LPK26_14900 [Bacillaceae bacterium]|nr:hypothetical protein [Bacillaceae bacterium]
MNTWCGPIAAFNVCYWNLLGGAVVHFPGLAPSEVMNHKNKVALPITISDYILTNHPGYFYLKMVLLPLFIDLNTLIM